MSPQPAKSKNASSPNTHPHQLHESIFYNLPRYYDIAFDREMDGEIAFYERCFNQYSPEITVKRILEPACGTGILLEALAHHNYDCMGYDLSETMVDYANKRLKAAGLDSHASVVVGDMKSKYFAKKFDAAIICINSLGYLVHDADIEDHFKAIARSLVPGGLYVVEISCACDDVKNEQKPDETWVVERDDVQLELTWAPSSYVIDKRIRHVDFFMKGHDDEIPIEVEEAHDLRLWFYDEFLQFAKAGGFTQVGLYNQSYQSIPLDQKITGELGVLYFVLKYA